ncbi:MAG: class I tRNA ligase family protein, partial [Promethearchaeota archaeon]
IDPDEVIQKVGAETYRFYCIKCTGPGEDMRFHWKDVDDTRRTLSILWNVYVFATTFMRAAEYEPTNHKLDLKQLQNEDRWILSQFNKLVEQVTERLEKYELPFVPRLIEDFVVKDLSRWYIKLIRPRTWVNTKDESKTAAFTTLYHVLKGLLAVIAPVLPLQSERMYQALVRPVESGAPLSVHMLPWAITNRKFIDEKLNREMDWAISIVETAQFIRQEQALKLRWPCRRLVLVPSDKEFSLKHFSDVVASQTNVKQIEIAKQAKDKMLKGKELPFCTVYLDIKETPELRAERLARDLIRSIQSARKQHGLHVTQKISLYLASKSKALTQALELTRDAIKSKVGATKLEISEKIPMQKDAAKGSIKFADEEVHFSFEQKTG